jgi:hypothetical protein
MYVQRYTKARSPNHFCRRKAIKSYIFWVRVSSIIYPACNAQAPYFIVICGLYGFTIIFHIIP